MSARHYSYFGTHGACVQVEYPERVKTIRRSGWGTKIVQSGGPGNQQTTNWFHIVIPTPLNRRYPGTTDREVSMAWDIRELSVHGKVGHGAYTTRFTWHWAGGDRRGNVAKTIGMYKEEEFDVSLPCEITSAGPIVLCTAIVFHEEDGNVMFYEGRGCFSSSDF